MEDVPLPQEIIDRLNRAEYTCAWLHRAVTYKVASLSSYDESVHDRILEHVADLSKAWFEGFPLDQKVKITASTQELPEVKPCENQNSEEPSTEVGSTDTVQP